MKKISLKIHPTRKKVLRKSLIKKLDKIVSELVIKRDGGKCVTCGSKERLGAGHLFSRIAYSTRWDLINCFAQCWPCNFHHEFDWYPLLTYFRETYGIYELEALHHRFKTQVRFNDKDLVNLYLKLEKII